MVLAIDAWWDHGMYRGNPALRVATLGPHVAHLPPAERPSAELRRRAALHEEAAAHLRQLADTLDLSEDG